MLPEHWAMRVLNGNVEKRRLSVCVPLIVKSLRCSRLMIFLCHRNAYIGKVCWEKYDIYGL